MSPAELAVRAPQPDQEAVRARLEAGFAAYPERKANWDKYLAATRGEQVDYQPIRMDYEVVSRCNFRCVMCMVRDWPGGKRAEDLPLADFKRSLDELHGLVEIKLQGLGEPLLHPDICEMVAEAARRHIWTRLTVNGSLLHVNQNYGPFDRRRSRRGAGLHRRGQQAGLRANPPGGPGSRRWWPTPVCSTNIATPAT